MSRVGGRLRLLARGTIGGPGKCGMSGCATRISHVLFASRTISIALLYSGYYVGSIMNVGKLLRGEMVVFAAAPFSLFESYSDFLFVRGRQWCVFSCSF